MRSALVAAVVALSLACFPIRARAQVAIALPDPFTVQDVVRIAHEHRAEIAAARARAVAAAQRPAIVSSLTDPMVMVAIDHLPISLMGINASAVVQQDFPLSGILGNRREVAEAETRRLVNEIQRTSLDVEFDAARNYFMLDERRRMRIVLDEQLTIARQIVALSNIRFAAGLVPAADVLRAQTELERLGAERTASDAQVRGAEAMLNASIGRAIGLPVPALASAGQNAPPATANQLASVALLQRPELMAMNDNRARARAEVRVMQSMYWPMAFVRAGPAYTMEAGWGAMIMMGVSLPIFRGRLRAGVAEANAMVAMTAAEIDAMRTMIQGEVALAREDVIGGIARTTALRERVLPLARETVTAVLVSYSAGQTPLVGVVDALRTLSITRQEQIMAEVNLAMAWARLDRATGRMERGRE